MSEYLTLRDIANRLNEKFHVVRYAVDVAGIEPAGRIGIVRVFKADQVDAVKAAVVQTSRRKEVVAHA